MSHQDDPQDQASSIHRCPHDQQNPYAQISRNLLRDPSISPNCRWLLCYLLSMKDGWNINIAQIADHVKDFMGRNKVYQIINEALEAGYMMREEFQVQGKMGGTLTRWRYFLSETPKFKKCYRHPENRDTGDRDTGNEDIKKEHLNKKEHLKEPLKKIYIKEKHEKHTPPSPSKGGGRGCASPTCGASGTEGGSPTSGACFFFFF